MVQLFSWENFAEYTEKLLSKNQDSGNISSTLFTHIWIYTVCISQSYTCHWLNNILFLQPFPFNICPFSRQIYRLQFCKIKYIFLFWETLKLWSITFYKSCLMVNGNKSQNFPMFFSTANNKTAKVANELERKLRPRQDLCRELSYFCPAVVDFLIVFSVQRVFKNS